VYEVDIWNDRTPQKEARTVFMKSIWPKRNLAFEENAKNFLKNNLGDNLTGVIVAIYTH